MLYKPCKNQLIFFCNIVSSYFIIPHTPSIGGGLISDRFQLYFDILLFNRLPEIQIFLLHFWILLTERKILRWVLSCKNVPIKN